MYAQVLEKAGYSVERHLGIGARQVRVPAKAAEPNGDSFSRRRQSPSLPRSRPNIST